MAMAWMRRPMAVVGGARPLLGLVSPWKAFAGPRPMECLCVIPPWKVFARRCGGRGRGSSAEEPSVMRRRPFDAANRWKTTMHGCGSPMLPAVRGCCRFGVVPTVSRRHATICGHVGCGQAVANGVSRPYGVLVAWFWRISNAEPVDNSSHGRQIL